jgi:hypothetical protein
MSIFASDTKKTIDLPFDPPHTITIQKLPGRHLGKAGQEHLYETVENLKRMGGPAFQRELQALGDEGKRKDLIDQYKADPLNSYDVDTLITKGLKAWSYEKPIDAPTIEDLDDQSRDFIAREILRLTKPSLFLTDEQAAAEQKNG